jgi:hypothetical protein
MATLSFSGFDWAATRPTEGMIAALANSPTALRRVKLPDIFPPTLRRSSFDGHYCQLRPGGSRAI